MLTFIGNALNVAGLILALFMVVPLLAIGTGSRAMRGLGLSLAGLAEAVTGRVGRAVSWLILIMAGVQFAIVMMRYVYGLNFIVMQESITYMHGAIFLLAAGYTLLDDDHVRVDVIYSTLSARGKALVNFIGTYAFLFPVCVLIIITSGSYVAQSWAVGEGSAEASGIQGVFLLKSLVPAFAVLLALQGFAVAARAADLIRGGQGSVQGSAPLPEEAR